MKFQFFLLLLLIYPCLLFSQAVDYDEFELPRLALKGKVKQVLMEQYYPTPGEDTTYAKLVSGFKIAYTFDRKGRIKESVLTRNEASYKNWEDRKTYVYHGDSSIIEYRSKGSLLERKIKVPGIGSVETVNRYNERHQPVEKIFYANKKVFLGRVAYIYDSRGFLMEERHYDEKNKLYSTTCFRNDAHGHAIDILMRSDPGNRSVHIVCTYDSLGDLASLTDTGAISYTFHYVRDGYGNWVKLTTCLYDDKKSVYYINERKISYYRGHLKHKK